MGYFGRAQHNFMHIDLIDLELLIRVLRQGQRLLEAFKGAKLKLPSVPLDAEDLAFYQALDGGDLSDRLPGSHASSESRKSAMLLAIRCT